MKTILTVFLAVLVAPLFANPIEKDFDGDATQLLSAVFNNCPIQFIQAMKGANRVGKASYAADRNKEVYEITTVGGGYAPTFQTYPVAVLKIYREVVTETLVAPDKPTHWKVQCELNSANR